MKKLKIRLYRSDDAPLLLELFTSSVHQIAKAHYHEEQLNAWTPKNRSLADWVQSFENKYVYIAYQEERIAGFAELEADGHIDRFYVSPLFTNCGVGSLLFQEIQKKGQDMSFKELYVEASITALPFFIKMGFTNPIEQKVERRGIEFINYRLRKYLTKSS